MLMLQNISEGLKIMSTQSERRNRENLSSVYFPWMLRNYLVKIVLGKENEHNWIMVRKILCKKGL